MLLNDHELELLQRQSFVVLELEVDGALEDGDVVGVVDVLEVLVLNRFCGCNPLLWVILQQLI